MNDMFLTTLGLARRAGKLFYGFDSCAENAHNIDILFLASDCSPRTKQSITDIFEQFNIKPIETNYNKNELAYAIGTKPTGIIGVADTGFANLLKSKLSEEGI